MYAQTVQRRWKICSKLQHINEPAFNVHFILHTMKSTSDQATNFCLCLLQSPQYINQTSEIQVRSNSPNPCILLLALQNNIKNPYLSFAVPFSNSYFLVWGVHFHFEASLLPLWPSLTHQPCSSKKEKNYNSGKITHIPCKVSVFILSANCTASRKDDKK